MANETATPRDIHLLTIDKLLTSLISGQAVALEDGKQLKLATDDARTVLAWYWRNRSRWPANLSPSNAGDIINVIGTKPPILETKPTTGSPHTIRRLTLEKIEAHRFAGLHTYCQQYVLPATFVFEPRKSVTVIEGVNGSGKTSIANAIIWCLTGHLIRPQRPPEEGKSEFSCKITQDGGINTTHEMSAVTPLPQKSAELLEDGNPIPADTWVELTFTDEKGARLPPIRRTQSRTPRGKITEIPPDLDACGIDPIAWQISTTMPALLPFLSVGSESELGEAVARLTGLAELVDLAQHAKKVSAKIKKTEIPEIKKLHANHAKHYHQAADDLTAIVIETPTIALKGVLPALDEPNFTNRISEIASHFIDLKTEALSEARGVLGDSFDPEDKKSRDNLEESIGPAIERLKTASELPSIARLVALKIRDDESAAVNNLLRLVEYQARILQQLATDPNLARRAQLYAKVSAWIHDHDYKDHDNCPVCNGRLNDTHDPVTGKPIVEHFAEAAQDREVIAQTISEWSTNWIGRMLRELPQAISAEARDDLPSDPTALLRSGFSDELFTSDSFCGVLLALKSDADELINKQLAKLPNFIKPAIRKLPNVLQKEAAKLEKMLTRIDVALAFAKWHAGNRDALRTFFIAVRNGNDGDADAPRAIQRRLVALRQIVDGVVPLNHAIEQVRRMKDEQSGAVAKEQRIASGIRAIEALDLLVPLGSLAQTQVTKLRQKLHERSEYWRGNIYRKATTFAPDLTDTNMNARGMLAFEVGRDGVNAPAQHVSNASALRGALFGFFLAFREHVLTERGGLSLLVLDDPQELLDRDNRERFARGLASVANDGAQLFITTHDRQFARFLVSENRPANCVQHLSVHAVNEINSTLRLSPSIEEVDRRYKEFLDNPDSPTAAQNYASDLRVFIEARLCDLFDGLSEPAHVTRTKALTLSPLLDKLRTLIASGGELFNHPTVKRFVNDQGLAQNAAPLRVLNTSHHNNKASITYVDVKDVEEDFIRLRKSIEEVHEQFRLYRWREPLASSDAGKTNVGTLPIMTQPDFSVPIWPDIAAFANSTPTGGSQATADEQLDSSWFENKAMFYIRGETMGFAIPSGAIAIVDAEPYSGNDCDLVIAQHRGNVLARRLVKAHGFAGVSLVAQMLNPQSPRPTMTFDESKVSLHRVVGVVFTDIPPPPAPKGEASLVETAVHELNQIKVACRVREDSAIPLVLPNQTILVGSELQASNLDGLEGKFVAVTLDDGASIFKRVGKRLTGNLGHLRQFETIGGLGSSMLIATEALGRGDNAPVMTSVRQVLGVLY